MDSHVARTLALRIAWHYLGTPYRWGGDDPMQGFDCSGFVVEVLRSAGVLGRNEDLTAAQMRDRFDAVVEPIPAGALVFWHDGSGNVVHVEMMVNGECSIGASGGGSATTSLDAAVRSNAYVKVRPIAGRPNLLGFADPFMD